MDDYIRQEMRKRHIPGLQLAVLRDGKPVKMGYYGLANVEHSVKVKRDTLFQIQSMTKSFVAVATLMLAEEGKLSVDDPLSRHLDGTPESWSGVTIRHLLAHTSGIKDFINEPTADLRLDVTEEEVFQATVPRPLNFPTGERYAYSNTNYHLLGMVIRKLTGRPWAQFVDERICRPLGMERTRVYSQEDVWPNRASGYHWRGNTLKNGAFVAPTVLGYAGGGLNSTIEDLAKWDAALYNEKLLKRSTMEQMWTSARLNNGRPAGYGFGWSVGENNGHRVVAHGGSHYTGFTSHMARYLDDRLTVIVLTNLSGANPASIVQTVANYYEPGIKAASAIEPKPDPDPVRTERMRRFLDELAAGLESPAAATSKFAASLDTDHRERAGEVTKSVRAFEFLEEEDVREEQKERNGEQIASVLAYRVTTDEAPWYCRFWLTEEGGIAAFSERE